MAAPGWWGTRRFGLFVHSNLATVPAWAPIGQYSDWYQSHLGDPVPDVLLHPTPMVEVLAHHRERWGHIGHVDDFLPLLTYDRFDPDEWAELARDAGMSYTVFVSKHHDGLCWWDAPNTSRSVLAAGPHRNVLAEYAAACARADIRFGTYYSLLDWGDARYPGPEYVEQVLHPHVLDLADRYGSGILWGDGHWGHDQAHWRTNELIERVRGRHPEIVVNDRWHVDSPDITTYEYQTPPGIVETPWELCRGIGHSFCHNRAERAEHHLTAHDIVALLTEVVAKGGNLLLNVGPSLDGSVPELQSQPLRAAGEWVRSHADLIEGAAPWTEWGDDRVRYVVPRADRRDDRAPQRLAAIALGGRNGGIDLTALGRSTGRVLSVSADDIDLDWEQGDDALRIRRLGRRPTGLATVIHVELAPHADAPIELFPPMEALPISLAELLVGARPGSVVQLGDGVHAGPATVPAGVTLRGLGPDRTVIDGGTATALTLERTARVEHLLARGGGDRVAWSPVPTVVLDGPDALVLGCRIEGHVVVSADRATVRACSLAGVVSYGASSVTVSRSRLLGMRWDVGVDIVGGYGHVVESCELHQHLCAIRLRDTLDATVRGNVIDARWWAIHLVDTEASHVVGNSITGTMRAVDVDGGSHAQVDGNAVADGDSGCVIERGAAGAVVSGNHWERCRIGLLAWDAAEVTHHGNIAVDLHEADRTVTVGP